MKAFTHISRVIDKIYKNLTKSVTVKMGGQVSTSVITFASVYSLSQWCSDMVLR
jgi:hypothetical protein